MKLHGKTHVFAGDVSVICSGVEAGAGVPVLFALALSAQLAVL